ncbi:MAG: hypothetical protein M0001_07145, partial [Treponema sp.]|nr:hypothetical protein [Treponema sp.]
AEDQINLFQVEGTDSSVKTRMTMRDGVFYISNGPAAKVLRISSYGDILSMIYNPSRNAGQAVGQGKLGGGPGRSVTAWPLSAPGEIAVDSKGSMYVEDRMPKDRWVTDQGTGSLYDNAVLRFDKDGNFQDYLGQEGVGGTPFPYILGIYTTASDDVVVISLMPNAWMVHWFEPKGSLRNSLKIPREALPRLGGDDGILASLVKIVPDSQGRAVILQVDYSREIVDPQTKSRSGIEYAGSWLYRMDLVKGTISDRWEIPPLDETSPNGDGSGRTSSYPLVPELLGTVGDRFFFVSIDDKSNASIAILNRANKNMERFPIEIGSDELFFNTMSLSPDGVLSALLGTKYEARVVWWRFDHIGRKDAGAP